mmetsp:Transcript_33452/g.54439  ORF Transcript_33452/g.54439 Transcript_33452/m.54439 type:complete len:212 (-) Transcript_33452:401-1036(-)
MMLPFVPRSTVLVTIPVSTTLSLEVSVPISISVSVSRFALFPVSTTSVSMPMLTVMPMMAMLTMAVTARVSLLLLTIATTIIFFTLLGSGVLRILHVDVVFGVQCNILFIFISIIERTLLLFLCTISRILLANQRTQKLLSRGVSVLRNTYLCQSFLKTLLYRVSAIIVGCDCLCSLWRLSRRVRRVLRCACSIIAVVLFVYSISAQRFNC